MNTPRFRFAVATLATALSVSLMAGCATSQRSQPATLSDGRWRALYPRDYLDTLNPVDRSVAESQMSNPNYGTKTSR